MSLMRKNRAGNGILIGALTGVVLGGSITYAAVGKNTGHAAVVSQSGAAAVGGVFFGLIGGLIGGFVGSAHDERFRIGGEYQNFEKVKSYFAP